MVGRVRFERTTIALKVPTEQLETTPNDSLLL